MINYHGPIDRIYQYLFVVACFFLPLTVAANNIAIYLIVLIWIFSGDYSKKFQKIKNNNLAIASIVFFLLHVVALIWTENISWGLEIVRKMLPFLLVLPILLTITRSDNVKFYIFAFLLAIGISELLSYLIWFGVIEPFGYAYAGSPTPIMSHVSYNPFLAFAIYIVVNELISGKKISQYKRAIYTFFILTMTFNMFITGGRAGQIMFFVAIILLAFQYFKKSQIKAIYTSVGLIALISITSYNFSPVFHERIQMASHEIVNYDANSDLDTSIGLRVNFLLNSWEIFNSSPLIGVGTGDFPDEYKVINAVNTPNATATSQPHNMYMLILTQLGLIGLISFLWMFYLQFKIALASDNHSIRNIGIAIPLLFLTIMWSDSYLLGHYTSNLFILFSSFIYSNR